ncbi:MAG: cytochrome c family protein [Acidobacteriia bacterium]|nr:cytochrome c family protein [Terriglobia bacterium]
MKHRSTYVFLSGVLIALGAGWAGFPYAIYESRPQPVDFSHKVHTGAGGMKCDDCHQLRPDGTFAGIPRLEKCAGCHAAAMGSTAEEKQFIDGYVTPKREVAWSVYARQPGNVYFPHGAHVKQAGLSCERCHGKHGQTETLRPYQEDRISGYSRDIWRGLTMGDCVACHEQHGIGQQGCLDCHK